MADKPKFLLIGDAENAEIPLVDGLDKHYEVVLVNDKMKALAKLSKEQFAGIYVLPSHVEGAFELGKALRESANIGKYSRRHCRSRF